MSGNEMRDLIKALKEVSKALSENTRLQKAVVSRLEAMDRDRKAVLKQPIDPNQIRSGKSCFNALYREPDRHIHGEGCTSECSFCKNLGLHGENVVLVDVKSLHPDELCGSTECTNPVKHDHCTDCTEKCPCGFGAPFDVRSLPNKENNE